MKVFNYIIITTGIMILVALAGIDIEGSDNNFQRFGININNDPTHSSIDTSDFYNKLFNINTGLLIIGILSGVVISWATGGKPENYIILPIISTHLIYFGIFMSNLIKYTISNSTEVPVIGYLSLLLLSPLAIGYLLALIEFFRGND